MMKPELETLFYPFTNGTLKSAGKRALFLNAHYVPALSDFDTLICVQHFKPYAKNLTEHGFDLLPPEAIAQQAKHDIVLIAAPKNIIETRGLVAQGIKTLQAGGVLVIAADNKAGGGRLLKILAEFGLQARSESRNKCRVVWAELTNFNSATVQTALDASAEQAVLNGTFISQPGVFGWNKIDAGSALLAEYLPEDFKGTGADFGCGYGYLSREIMARGDKIKTLYALDADARAIALCARNVKDVETRWTDITQANSTKNLKGRLDFIVMNPPFHEGKGSNNDIGTTFIRQAAACLRRNGILWMVANAHLPYERTLEECFFSHQQLVQANGFKVFKAVI